MKFLRLGIFSALAASAITGCDNFEYHPYSVKIHGLHNVNEQNIAAIQKLNLKEPFKFVFISDTQGSNDETEDALRSIRERGDIDFIIHGGDISDFGLPKEFIWCRDMFEDTGIPYVTILGNHDCLGNGKQSFEYIFGKTNYSFTVAHTHFVCLNTIALEYDYSEPVPDLNFLEDDILAIKKINGEYPGSITHTVVAMHSRPYDEQFNNNVAKAFNGYITHYPGMNENDPAYDNTALPEFRCGTRLNAFCVNGHNHNLMVKDIFENGLLYYQCANAGKRQYFVFTINENGYEWENVCF